MHSILWGGAFFKIHPFSHALRCLNRMLEANSLDLVLGETLFRAVVELGRARAFMCRHGVKIVPQADHFRLKAYPCASGATISGGEKHRLMIEHKANINAPGRLTCPTFRTP
jgi:hypothetical protein